MKEPWQEDDPAEDTLLGGWEERAEDPYLEMWCGKLEAMKEEMGAKAFNEFAIRLAIREESELRARNPDHPLLILLDNHRLHEEQGFF
jgi:hypothetical protein